MAAIAMLHHMPTSQAVQHATTLVSGTALPPTLLAAIIFPDKAQILHRITRILSTAIQTRLHANTCTKASAPL